MHISSADERCTKGDLDDFRRLFAHNYAGEADATYSAKKTSRAGFGDISAIDSRRSI
jgi:hypothetical protein